MSAGEHTQGETWIWLDTGPGDPFFNMALDEALLEGAAKAGCPVVRSYGWAAPAATYGYFQGLEEIGPLTRLRPLVRRPTGGGLVPHDRDWTYSVAIPPSHPWWRRRARESYRMLHEWLRDSLVMIGIPAHLAPERDPSGPGQCFVGAEADDLILHGRKIAGAAQRRNRLGMLIQGSLQPPLGAGRASWHSALRAAATARFGVAWRVEALSPETGERARILRSNYTADTAEGSGGGLGPPPLMATQ